MAKDFSGVLCKVCQKEGKEMICRGFTGLSTHVRKAHSIKYDTKNRLELGEPTDKSPNQVPIEHIKRKYVRKDKTLQGSRALKMSGRILPTGTVQVDGDRLLIPAMIEITAILQARMVQPEEE